MNIEELYQEIILDHSKRPRNFGSLPDATAMVKGDNPSCGDEVELSVKLTPQAIEALKFTGHGCAICMASASLMTVRMRGKPRTEAQAAIEAFRHMLTAPEPGEPPDSFGDLLVFGAVRRFPQRVKCAMLAWRALEQALSSAPAGAVSTEETDT
ncbi:MAG TPA: SUF system NifU family Fe-S cluster assembly protein [Terrimicrobiaceae bacterium]|nr:SUF system NifU family Fe-S cluster assembly protein [Terrimicrobiaceae bacterium]